MPWSSKTRAAIHRARAPRRWRCPPRAPDDTPIVAVPWPGKVDGPGRVLAVGVEPAVRPAALGRREVRVARGRHRCRGRRPRRLAREGPEAPAAGAPTGQVRLGGGVGLGGAVGGPLATVASAVTLSTSGSDQRSLAMAASARRARPPRCLRSTTAGCRRPGRGAAGASELSQHRPLRQVGGGAQVLENAAVGRTRGTPVVGGRRWDRPGRAA